MNLNAYIDKHGTTLIKDRGAYLFRQGDADSRLYMVRRGLLKAYYLSEEGKENIKSFLLPGDTIGSLMAGYGGEACTFNLVCLEPSHLTVLDFSALYQASRTDPEISAEIVDFLLRFGMKKENREYELLCLTAEERYKRLLKNTPELLDQVTQNEIARYLGVTPVGLSRIKKRIGG